MNDDEILLLVFFEKRYYFIFRFNSNLISQLEIIIIIRYDANFIYNNNNNINKHETIKLCCYFTLI